ncbi:MAG: DegV family protein [Lachnospiraceae bacterium]|nr:DegV family protein [Lachnospiraceae bacterium]
MSKVAVVTDSNSGITQAESAELGVYVLPMPFTIQDKDYFEDINLTQEGFYEMLRDDVDIATSQPSPDAVKRLWEDVLKDHDEIVYIPMSSGLSGSCQTAIMLSDDYDGKVQVVNNQRISVTQRQSCLDALRLASEGSDAAAIKAILEEDKFNSSIYIMLDTLYYLKKGGRITPAAAALGTLLRIKPVLQIQGEKLDAFAKARTVSQGKSIMIEAVKSDMEKRFGGVDPNNCHLHMAYSYDRVSAEAYKEEVMAAFPGFQIHMDPLALSVSCHIGPGALALACTGRLKF